MISRLQRGHSIPTVDVAVGENPPFVRNGTALSRDLRHQRVGVADVPRALPALDRGEGRLQQRPRIIGRTRVAREPGEVGLGAQFE